MKKNITIQLIIFFLLNTLPLYAEMPPANINNKGDLQKFPLQKWESGDSATNDSTTDDNEDSWFTDEYEMKVSFQDADGDGYGNLYVMASYLASASPKAGYVDNPYDCDDTNSFIYYQAPELCADGIDQDCDAIIDNGCPPSAEEKKETTIWFADDDADGYGNPDNILTDDANSSTPPQGYVGNDLDCDDTDKIIYLGAIEICNDGTDQDCDGTPDNNCGTIPEPTAATDTEELPETEQPDIEIEKFESEEEGFSSGGCSFTGKTGKSR